MTNLTKTIVLIAVFAVASAVVPRECRAQDTASRLAKLGDTLKKLDKNGNGQIDADEAATAAGKLLMDRYFPSAPPQYPIAISEVLKVAEAKLNGAPAPAVSSGTSGSAPAAQSTASAVSSSGGPSSETPSPDRGSGFSSRGRGGSRFGPPGGSAPAASSTQTPRSTTTSAAPDSKPAWSTKSGRFRTAKERLPAGLPDWFLKKVDSEGQIKMSDFETNWTPDKVKEFEKYDLNHDGVITADEALKVEKHGGK